MHRYSFNRLENQLYTFFKIGTGILLLPQIPIYFARYTSFIGNEWFSMVYLVYSMGVFMQCLGIYRSSSLSLIYEMYKHHRMAFNSHIVTLVILYLATEGTLLLVIY